jgi:hypothetical protein
MTVNKLCVGSVNRRFQRHVEVHIHLSRLFIERAKRKITHLAMIVKRKYPHSTVGEAAEPTAVALTGQGWKSYVRFEGQSGRDERSRQMQIRYCR